MNATTARPLSFSAGRVITGWLAGASAIALSGVLPRAPLIVPGAIVSSVLTGVVAYRRSAALRAWVASIDVRKLMALHLLRAPIGMTFLFLYSKGLLPALFALRAGVGDTVIGLLAIAAIAIPSRRGRLLWNALGLVDITMSVATAFKAVIFARVPVALATMGQFPFPLIPFFVVPAVVLTHLALFTRLRRPTS